MFATIASTIIANRIRKDKPSVQVKTPTPQPVNLTGFMSRSRRHGKGYYSRATPASVATGVFNVPTSQYNSILRKNLGLEKIIET